MRPMSPEPVDHHAEALAKQESPTCWLCKGRKRLAPIARGSDRMKTLLWVCPRCH